MEHLGQMRVLVGLALLIEADILRGLDLGVIYLDFLVGVPVPKHIVVVFAGLERPLLEPKSFGRGFLVVVRAHRLSVFVKFIAHLLLLNYNVDSLLLI